MERFITLELYEELEERPAFFFFFALTSDALTTRLKGVLRLRIRGLYLLLDVAFSVKPVVSDALTCDF